MRSQQGVDDVAEQVVTTTSGSTRLSITFLSHVSYTPTSGSLLPAQAHISGSVEPWHTPPPQLKQGLWPISADYLEQHADAHTIYILSRVGARSLF